MEEIIFKVRECDEGGYIASAVSASIITEAATPEELKEMVKDAVYCHYDTDMPEKIGLQFASR